MRPAERRRLLFPAAAFRAGARPRDAQRFITACGVAGLLGVAWFVAALVLVWVGAASGLDWTRHYVSQFVNAPRGWLLTVGILGHAVGNAALGVGLYRALPSGKLQRWASALFLLATAGLALTGMFAVDASGAPASRAGAVHRAAVATSFGLELGALALFTAVFARAMPSRVVARVSVTLSALAAAGSGMLVAAIALDWRQGLAERAAVAAFMAWEAWVSWQLASGRITWRPIND